MSAVQNFAEEDTPRRRFHIGGFVYDTGRLAAEFQRYRRQILRSCFHHQFTDYRTAGKEDIIELLLQKTGVLFSSAGYHGYKTRIKGLRNQCSDYF